MATRIQNNSSSLIDHIITNQPNYISSSGVIISDISDHFITYIELNSKNFNHKQKILESRNFSKQNIVKFKANLQNADWHAVFNSEDVDESYNAFWDIFSTLFNLHFPLTKTKFNKNFHKLNCYMTNGLLVSRQTKINLHHEALTKPNYTNFK